MDVKPDPANLGTWNEEKRDGFRYWTPDNYLATPQQQEINKRDDVLRERAQVRAVKCCIDSCDKNAIEWALEIKFDLRPLNSSIEKTAMIDTIDDMNELPGFCFAHLHVKAPDLAKAVFYSHPLTAWGYSPSRWIVRYTDGSSDVGGIEEIKLPIIIEATDTLIRDESQSN